jgi:MreB/Mbl protein.
MRGLDVGTSFLISAKEGKGDTVIFSEIRDAFFRLTPTSPISASMIQKGLAGKKHFKDTDGSYVVVGQDAIEKAVERHLSALRPMHRGIISPKEKDARRILKYIMSEVLGPPTEKGEKLVYCVPAQPIDEASDDFDVGYHEDALNMDLRSLGYEPSSINEAEAICYSELANDDYTGVALSFGAGLVNIAVMSSGEAVLKFSLNKSGDYVDRMAATSTGTPDSVVQIEKENGDFTVGQEVPDSIVLSAVSSYYVRLIDYAVKNLAARLNGPDLPKFTKPIPIVIAGGTSKAKGFIEQFNKALAANKLSIPVSEVRSATDPLRAVARGCLIAGSVL